MALAQDIALSRDRSLAELIAAYDYFVGGPSSGGRALIGLVRDMPNSYAASQAA